MLSLSRQARCMKGSRAYSTASVGSGLRGLLASKPRFRRSPLLTHQIPLQRRYAGSEPTKIPEDDHLDQTRNSKEEGAIMAVQSGLFKLLLPLPNVPTSSLAKRLAPASTSDGEEDNGVLFLLHPKQPLSMIATLIQSEISNKDNKEPVEVTFHGAEESVPSIASDSHSSNTASSSSSQSTTTETGDSTKEQDSRSNSKITTHQWAQSTELGDFVQEAAKDRKFVIAIKHYEQQEDQQPSSSSSSSSSTSSSTSTSSSPSSASAQSSSDNGVKLINIRVPSFEERTLYLRRRLNQVTKEMQSLLDIKSECDMLALKGARRMAMAGFGGLLSYWGGVYFLTFHVYGWDLMEPVTYLTGLSGLMGGYLWFLFNQKEISYRSVFEMSSSKRREQLYDTKGFDRNKWKDLIDEGTELRRAIKKIAIDYTINWDMNKELNDEKAADEIKKHEKKKFGKDSVSSESSSDKQKDHENHSARSKS